MNIINNYEWKIITQKKYFCEVSGPYGGEYEDDSILGHSAMYSG
jgi:hypothetical protein